jgi:ABC-type Na+ efflux pump permease subunit
MLRDALFIARKDVQYMLRARETILWVFVMPPIFFLLIGSATSGFGRSGGAAATTLAVEAGEGAGFLLERLEQRLREQDYAVVSAADTASAGVTRRLIVPAAFTDSVLAGVRTRVTYRHEREGQAADYENLRVGRAVYATLADVAAVTVDGGPATPEKLVALDAMPRALTLEVKSAGKRRHVPTGFEQAIPGILVMFLLLVMATSGSVMLVLERQQGLLRRLASAPIARLAVVLGKVGGKLALGIVQVAFAMAAGTVFFKMNWGKDLASVVLVMAVYGAMMAALGVVLGSVVRTERQAVAIGVISANVLAALGGCWWPIEITPGWMQTLAKFLPTGWAMGALHNLISFGAGPGSVVPHLAVMLAATAALAAAAVRVFRFE